MAFSKAEPGKTRVGWIGTGVMGRWMCQHLITKGFQATVYNLERLRCNLCGQVFTAEAPAGVGADKYDETVGSMVAQLKYGSGMPFNRLEKLEQRLGVPLPATTQWEIVEEAAELLGPAYEELIRQGAQGEIFHNDDTSMKILQLERPEGDTRTGCLHQWDRLDQGKRQDGPVLHRTATFGGKSGGCVEAARKRAECAHPDVRCTLEECAETIRRCGGSAGVLPCARTKAVCGRGRKLS